MKAILLLSSFFAASISAAACLQYELCIGDRVMDSSNRLALVLGIADQNMAILKLDDHTFPVNRAILSLSKKIKCYQNICGGDRVLDAADQLGVVTDVFDNGKAQVKFDSGDLDIRVAVTLGKGVKCIEKTCIEQNINDLGDGPGVIKELFDSGKALVKFDRSVFLRVRSFLSLDIQTPCKNRDNCPVMNPAQAPKQPQQKQPKPIGLRGH